jgi:signal transduction histidine kinase
MERRALGQSLLVLVVTFVAGVAVVERLERGEVQERRRAALELARGSGVAIEKALEGALASATTLARMVEAGATDAQLATVATGLLELHGPAVSLQLARGGVISHVWPLQGNEAALGLDLVASPIHGPLVQQVLSERRALLYGPFPLVQGGIGLALREPVVVPSPAGGTQGWGLSSVVLRLPGLLAESRLDALAEAGFDYTLSRPAQAGLGPVAVAASVPADARLVTPEAVEIQLPGQVWTLEIAPRAGWQADTRIWTRMAATLLLALLGAALTYRVLSLPAVLRREVAARTQELELAHREQRRAEAAQRQSQKLESLGLLAGGVAHDFNNLLVAILGHAELMAVEAVPGSPQLEGAQTIMMAAKRAAQLTRQLLAFARLGHHREEEVDLHALAQEVAQLLGRTLDKSIRIELRLQAAAHHVVGDPGQLQQVLLNLAVNARDAMPEGGTLTLETSLDVVEEASAGRGLPTGRFLVVSVTDTGVGIPREQQERIFEPFFTTKPEGRGTGLGLATAYGIVKGHGGVLRVYSEVGIGSRFMVYLPVGERSQAAAAKAGELPRGTGTVLIIDDEPLVRRTAALMLTSLGYTPVMAPGGPEALDWIAAQPAPPVAVLLDLAMPGMDGPTCFRALRERHPGLGVVVSSGFARNGRAQALLDEGARAFVQKPYQTDELARAVAAATAG